LQQKINDKNPLETQLINLKHCNDIHDIGATLTTTVHTGNT